MDFQAALTAAYQQTPCQVLPNALWKTLREIPACQHEFEMAGGLVSALRLWDTERLLVYWKAQAEQIHFSEIETANLKLALVHQRALPLFPAENFPHHTAYFRYAHSLDTLPDAPPPPGFGYRAARPLEEAAQIADFISRCYPNITQTKTNVLGWTQTPVYQPDLWLWLVDEASGQPAALGIADHDRAIGEGSLEWIQVLPEYRRRGLGEALVFALLRRLSQVAKFVTVSGEIANPCNPGGLYRRCGFMGEDIWWVLKN